MKAASKFQYLQKPDDTVENFAHMNNCPPARIMVYRDGVSEQQLAAVV